MEFYKWITGGAIKPGVDTSSPEFKDTVMYNGLFKLAYTRRYVT
jgi:hypothetical protein